MVTGLLYLVRCHHGMLISGDDAVAVGGDDSAQVDEGILLAGESYLAC